MFGSGRDHAVVLGGGLAGLLAARVLADRYAHVTVVDRDDIEGSSAGIGCRRGVPQGRHAHVLLARGLHEIEALLPGLTDELLADGAASGDPLAEARLCFGGYRFRQGRSGLQMLSLSRPFLEAHVADRVLALPNVAASPASDVAGLASASAGASGGRRVTGVRVFRRTDGSTGETMPAALVVDATGRGSRAPTWLAELGYPKPPEERVGVDVRYVSCEFRLPADALNGDWGCLIAPTPEQPVGAAFARLEYGRWLLTVIGVDGVRPPADPAGLAAFVRSLPFADVAEAIDAAEPLGSPVGYRFPGNKRRRYEHLTRLPAGLILLGDSVCSFNPIYGQGMTVAALGAVALRDHLGQHSEPEPMEFQRTIAEVVDTPWEMALGGDLAFPGAAGKSTRKLRVLNRYLARLQAAAGRDPAVGTAFMRATGLVDPAQALMRPTVAARVVLSSLTGSRRLRSGEEGKRNVASKRESVSEVRQGGRDW